MTVLQTAGQDGSGGLGAPVTDPYYAVDDLVHGYQIDDGVWRLLFELPIPPNTDPQWTDHMVLQLQGGRPAWDWVRAH